LCYFVNISLIKLNTSWGSILVIYSNRYNFFCVQSVQETKKISASTSAWTNCWIVIDCSHAAIQAIHGWFIKEFHVLKVWSIERTRIVVAAVADLVIDCWGRLSNRKLLCLYVYADCSILVEVAVCESWLKKFLAL